MAGRYENVTAMDLDGVIPCRSLRKRRRPRYSLPFGLSQMVEADSFFTGQNVSMTVQATRA